MTDASWLLAPAFVLRAGADVVMRPSAACSVQRAVCSGGVPRGVPLRRWSPPKARARAHAGTPNPPSLPSVLPAPWLASCQLPPCPAAPQPLVGWLRPAPSPRARARARDESDLVRVRASAT